MTPQRLLLFISSLTVGLLASVVFAGEIFEPSKLASAASAASPQQEFDQQQQIEKVMADFSNNGHDFSDEIGLQQQQPAFIRADVPRASSRWYLLNRGGAAAAPSSFLPTWALNLAGNSRQLEKKQNHKKNPRANPRDILRGLAVKRDHFY